MNAYVLYYDGFCEFEVVFAINNFQRDNLTSVALENRIYVSEEKQKYVPDKTIAEINPDDVDIFIIPGGDPNLLCKNNELKEFLLKLNEKNKFIAGICGGSELLAYYGILDNRKANGDTEGYIITDENREVFNKIKVVNDDVVRDGNCITAVGQAFIEFAIEIARACGMYEKEEEAQEDYNWLKNIK